MKLSHSIESKDNTKINKTDILRQISDFSETIHSINKCYDSYEEVEKKIQKMVNQLEISLNEKALEQYDINTKIVEVDGQIFRQVLRHPKSYLSAAGLVEVERSLYRNSAGETICPLELQSGIIEGYWTPTAARIGYYVTAELSPYAGEKLLKEMGRFTPSKSSLGRLAMNLGETWEIKKNDFNSIICHEELIPEDSVTMSVSFDGIMLPMNKKIENGYKPEKESNTDKNTEKLKEKPFYREASCAAISLYDQEGERLKTLRFGRMPEEGKKALKAQIAQTVSHILNQQPGLNLVKLADGAKDNWRYLSNELLPGQGTEMLDFYHASEHLSDGIDAAHGKGSSEAKAEYKKYRSVLKYDSNGVEKVINMLRYLSQKQPDNDKIKTELKYFRNNRHRMSYALMEENNFPIGSGVTEASCKTLVTQRMKCAGMRWDISGGQGVLTARSLIQSEQFTQGWELLSKMYKTKVSLPENVVAFKPRG